MDPDYIWFNSIQIFTSDLLHNFWQIGFNLIYKILLIHMKIYNQYSALHYWPIHKV